MMNKNITVDELAKALVAEISAKHGPDKIYPYLFGVMTGLVETMTWSDRTVQEIINKRYAWAQEFLNSRSEKASS
jgi:hypothetical protein